MSRIIKKGATSQSIDIEILDTTSTTGGRKTGLVFNTAGLTAYYKRNGGSPTAITLVTLAAINSAWSSGGFKEADATNMPGVYRLDVPDAALAAGAGDSVVITVRGATGGCQVSSEIQLVAFDPQDAVRGGMTALPNVAAGVSGGLPTIDAALNVSTFAVDSGTAQAGAAATITLRAAASATDSLFNGSVLTIYGGTGAGQSRVITGYVGATKVATVGRNWAVNPDSTSIYKIHGLSVPRVDDNLAVIVQSGTGTGQLSFASGILKVDVDTIKTNPVVNAGTITFPTGATLASTTNITAGTLTTVTNLTNLPTIPANWLTAAGTAADFGAEVAAAIWRDTVAGDFTVALSVGKSLMNGVALGTGLTINGYTGNTAQTGDNFARLGAPAGASVSADIAAVNAKTTNLPAAPASTTNIVSGTITNVTNVTNLTNAPISGDFTAVMKTSLNAATPAVTFSVGERNAMADAFLDRDMSVGTDSGSPTYRTPRQGLRFLRNKWTVTLGGLTVCKEDDTTTSWTAAVTTDPSAIPIIGNDPAG